MEGILTGLSNYRTTLIGFALGVLYYLDKMGAGFPKDASGWTHFVVAGLLAGLGYVAKDAMTGSKPFVFLLALGLTVGGCATVPPEIQKIVTDLSNFTNADLDRAIAMAGAANPVIDAGAPYRARCYATLKKYVPSGQTVGDALLPIGIVSGGEAAMELDARLRSGHGVPADVHADCAVLAMNAVEFAGRVGLKLGGAAGVPGLGAAGGLLGR